MMYSNNNVEDQGVAALAKTLEGCKKVEQVELQLGHTLISKAGCASLGQAVSRMKSVIRLGLDVS